jgi:hypothetical protein
LNGIKPELKRVIGLQEFNDFSKCVAQATRAEKLINIPK